MPSNIERANRARIALTAYTAQDSPAYAREDVETRVRDLICDLLHLVAAESDAGVNLHALEDRVMGAALMNNLEERDEDACPDCDRPTENGGLCAGCRSGMGTRLTA